MPGDVFPLLLLLSLFGMTHGCLQDPASAYRYSGAVCRLTYPAAVVCEFFAPFMYLIDLKKHLNFRNYIYVHANRNYKKMLD